MTPDARQKLREAAQAAQQSMRRLRPEGSVIPHSPPWELQTSNSFRRIGMHGDGDVLCAVTHRSDHHPDLLAPPGVLNYIVAAQPHVVIALLDQIDSLEAKLDAVIKIGEAFAKKATSS